MWKQQVVTGMYPDVKIIDKRYKVPMVMLHDRWDTKPLSQEIDIVSFEGSEIPLLTPNVIAIHLSISEHAKIEALTLFDKIKKNIKEKKEDSKHPEKRNDVLRERSKLVCDYLEKIQTSIIFSVTAIETFANMSIPDDYIYKVESNKKTELYNKQQIERNITLKDKISKILVDIYDANPLSEQSFWNDLIELIKIRDNIVHQKNIDDTFYNEILYEKRIFQRVESSTLIINFFQDSVISQKESQRNLDFWPIIEHRPIMLHFIDGRNVEPDIGQHPSKKSSKKKI